MKKKALIIGGGLGGLATALTLSAQYDVRIIEKNKHLGGKMQAIEIDGFSFDYGPNTLTMPHYFWQVLAPFGNPQQLLPFQKIDKPSHHTQGEWSLTFTTDQAEMVRQLAQIDTTSAANYPAFIKEITRLYQLSEQNFLEKSFFTARDYLDVGLMASLPQMHPFKTLDQFLRRYFPHPFVRQLFGRFATYIGSSPYATPATFALIAYFELVEGTYYIPGGATKIAAVFEELLRKQGVAIHTGESVLELTVEGQKITGCRTACALYEADVVISNVDYHMFQRVLKRDVVVPETSTSAYIELIGLKTPAALAHHNVLFSAGYEQEFTALRAGQYATQPTVYSCYPFASDQSRPPALFVLINAPGARQTVPPDMTAQVDAALEVWGIDPAQIATRTVYPPSYIAEHFATMDGAIYGQASNTLAASFFRPRNRDRMLRNLYYVGGTVHPGGGSPVVVKAGYSLANRLLQEM